jgi:hypothetical protein
VPLTIFGDFTIKSHLPLGDMGASESEAVEVYWPLYRHFFVLLAWIPVFVFLLLKPNRALRAWMVLPLLLVLLIASHILENQHLMYMPQARALLFILTALWLLGYISGKGSRIAALVRILLLLLFMSAMTWIAENGIDVQSIRTLTFYAVPVGAGTIGVFCGLFFARQMCRKKPRRPRFLLWALLGQFVVSAMLFFAMAAIGNPRRAFSMFMLERTLSVSAGGSVILFCYLLLALYNRLFRERLEAVLRMPSLIPEKKAEK